MSDKIKTLSQAIRIGATYRPQCRRHLFATAIDNVTSEERIIGSCALGAAIEALGYLPCEELDIRELEKRFDGITSQIVVEITTRNDSLCWTREQIADWLEAQGL